MRPDPAPDESGLHASVEAPDEVDTARAELRRLRQLLGRHPDATGCVPR